MAPSEGSKALADERPSTAAMRRKRSDPSRPETPRANLPEVYGRSEELRQIDQLLDRARRGEGGVLFISGAVGVGKTRLVAEARDRALRAGMAVLSADCRSYNRRRPYAPWVELIRGFVDTAPRSRVYELTRPNLGALTQLAPELKDRVWLHDPESAAPPLGQRALLDAVAQFFLRMARSQPLLVALDDIDSADAGSLELLESLIRASRGSSVAVVGAYRDAPREQNAPLQFFLMNLADKHSVQNLRITELTQGDVARILAEVRGPSRASRGLEEQVFRKTRGNPYYVREWVRWLLQSDSGPEPGAATSSSASVPSSLPASIETAIEEHLGWQSRDLPEPSPKRIAVLPFTNFSPDPKDEFFADGLTEELITVLSQLGGLRVIARTSVMPYKSASKGAHEVGRELQVSTLLEGSVRRTGNRIRVAAQLIDVNTEDHLWSETYDRELEDIFAVQNELAQQVAEALKVELRPKEEARLEERPKVQPESYLAYLRGRTHLYQYTRTALGTAEAEFRKSLSIDPRNAAAHAGLAHAIGTRELWYPTPERLAAINEMRLSAVRAIELDPRIAEGHAAMGDLLWFFDTDLRGAEKEYQVALELNPSYSLARMVYGAMLENLGRIDEALTEFTLAEAADPRWAENLWRLALLLTWLGRFEEAEVRLAQLGSVAPEHERYHLALANYRLARGDLDSCLKELARLEEVASEPAVRPAFRALSLALSDRKSEAAELLHRNAEALRNYHGYNFLVVWAFCEIGDIDECFRWLHRVYVGFQSTRLSPRLEPVRRDPRFRELLRAMKLG